MKKKNKDKKEKNKGFQPASDLFSKYQLQDRGGYITREFQDFGYRLAVQLEDTNRVSLYMKMAKEQNRAILERALSFVSDAPNVRNKAALFMWKLKQLNEEKKKNEK